MKITKVDKTKCVYKKKNNVPQGMILVLQFQVIISN